MHKQVSIEPFKSSFKRNEKSLRECKTSYLSGS